MSEGVEAGNGEEANGGDLADGAPVGAVRGEAEHGAIVAHESSGGGVGAGGEGHVVGGGEAVPRGGAGGDDEGAAEAEAEEEGRTEVVGHGAQLAVELVDGAEAVEVADHRPRPGRLRRTAVGLASAFGVLDDKEEAGEESSQS